MLRCTRPKVSTSCVGSCPGRCAGSAVRLSRLIQVPEMEVSPKVWGCGSMGVWEWSGQTPMLPHYDGIALRRQALHVAREEGRFADVCGVDQAGDPALETDGEAAVGRHPRLERLQVAGE